MIERRKDAMMQMLLRFDPSRNASGRHLPLCSTSTKILGSVLEQHTTHQCNGFIGTTLLYAMHSVQDFSSLVQSSVLATRTLHMMGGIVLFIKYIMFILCRAHDGWVFSRSPISADPTCFPTAKNHILVHNPMHF